MPGKPKPDDTPDPEDAPDPAGDEEAAKLKVKGWMREALSEWQAEQSKADPDDADDPEPVKAPAAPRRARAPRPSGGTFLDVLLGR